MTYPISANYGLYNIDGRDASTCIELDAYIAVIRFLSSRSRH